MDVSKAMGRGAAWMIAGRFLDKVIGLVNTIVLARLLAPEHFGVVAIATSIIAALELMGAFSFDTVLIQRQDATREHYDTVWTIGLAFNLVYALALVLLAWPAAAFYNDARLVETLLILAASRVIAGLLNVGIVDFRKQLQFSQDFYFNLARKVVTVALTIGAAYVFNDHRALLVGITFGTLYTTALSYVRHPFRPRLSLARRAELFSAAKWLFLNNVFFFINTRYADFVLGKALGLSGLGTYHIANELSWIPVSEIAMPINRAAVPAYARLSGDQEALEALYRRTVAAMVMLTFPIAVGLAACADLLVTVVLGPKWSTVGEVLPILALSAMPLIAGNNNGTVLLALSHNKSVVLLSSVRSMATVIGVPIGIWFDGLKGACWAVLCVNLLWAPFCHWILVRKTRIRLRDFFLPLIWPTLGCVLTWFAILSLRSIVPPSALGLVAVAAGAGMTYVATIALAWTARGRPDGVEADAWRVARRLRNMG